MVSMQQIFAQKETIIRPIRH